MDQNKLSIEKIGLEPGTLIHIGEGRVDFVTIEIIDYDATSVRRVPIKLVEECLPFMKNPDSITWVDIRGLSDVKTIEEIGKILDIHRLWLEDVLNTRHRPKAEELDDLFFLVLKTARLADNSVKHIKYDQVSLFLGKNFVVSLQERDEDIFAQLKMRFNEGKIQKFGADYLFYQLSDFIVDEYYRIIDFLGSKIEKIDEQILSDKLNQKLLHEINRLKNELLFCWKNAVPMRDLLQQLYQSQRADIQPKTRVYFKDVYDHTNHVVEVIDNYRHMLVGIQEVYIGLMNQKMNEIMKVLTVFMAIFIPLTFIVGVYGMNFHNMPELQWEWGYYSVWMIMIIVVLVMTIYFRKKKWI